MKISGNQIVQRALEQQSADTLYYLMGGPTLEIASACVASKKMRMIDVRHEQAGAMMAIAHSRILGEPAFCMAASGPGVTNLVTGLAHALVDCAPVVALGGSSPVNAYNTGYFQEIDQVAIMKPVTKWAERVYETRRIPEYIDMAVNHAISGKPGPVYLDLPGDVLYAEVEEDEVVWVAPRAKRKIARPAMVEDDVRHVMALLRESSRPIILTGSGIIWSKASNALTAFVEKGGIPYLPTPQGRGVLPDDHKLAYAAARNVAMREADLVIVAGTRLNYTLNFGKAPRFSDTAKFIRIDIDPVEIGTSARCDVGVVADVGIALKQLSEAMPEEMEKQFTAWRDHLDGSERERSSKNDALLTSTSVPIHPLRLCKEVRDFIDRDAILVVDGAEILNYARQSIPTFLPAHRLNSGVFGTMGVGLPFALGAKVAAPERQVVVLHGDGSFGINGMELDTAIRHNIPVLVVISLNGGWSADPTRSKPGRELGYTRFDRLAESLGCHGEWVEQPDDIRPALERAYREVLAGRSALVNVVTDWSARAATAKFTTYMT